MKKIISLLIALVMIFSLTACNDDKDIRGDQIDNRTTQATLTNEENVSQTKDKEFSLGTVSGLTYENKFIGIGCKLSDEWTFYTDEEILKLNNIALEMGTEDFAEQLKDALENADVFYDMMASTEDSMEYITVNFGKVNNIALASLDIIENYKDAAKISIQQLESIGYTNCIYEIIKVTIDGQELDAMCISSEIEGLNFYYVMFSIKCDGYIANITVGAYDKEKITEIHDCIYFL